MNAQNLRHGYGQNLIEFGLTFSFFIFIVLVVFDLGRIVYSANVLQNATREGAREAIINNCMSDGEIAAIVRDRALAVDPASITVNPVVWGDDTVQVSAEAEFTPLIPVYNLPLISWAFPVIDEGNPADPSDDIHGIEVASSSTMLRESWKTCGP
jgi:Flp pilus assembly protein TadG